MSGLFDDLVGAVGAVAATAAPSAVAAAGVVPVAPADTPPSIEDRLAAVEQFALTWGPTLIKLAPLLEKLEAL